MNNKQINDDRFTTAQHSKSFEEKGMTEQEYFHNISIPYYIKYPNASYVTDRAVPSEIY